MLLLIAIILAVVVIAVIRSFLGTSVVALYQKDPTAALLEIAKTWFEAQPTVDIVKFQEVWPSVSAILSQPDVVAEYKAIIELYGPVTVTANTLTKAFSQLFLGGVLSTMLAPQFEKCARQ